jgi:hypothetical protein
MWQGAWMIAMQELRLAWRGYLLTLFFLAYTAFFSTLILYGRLSGELSGRAEFGLDLGYFTILPLFGFLMDAAMFRYRKEDTYSRKLAEWQTMPIGVFQIVAGRMMLYILLLLVNCLLYFSLQYAVLGELRDMLGPAGFALNFLSWFGYCIVVGLLLVYMELGYPGRVYFKFCFVHAFGILAVALLLAAIGKSAVLFFLQWAADRDWEPAAVMMAAAAVAVPGFGALLHRRINRRSFWT